MRIVLLVLVLVLAVIGIPLSQWLVSKPSNAVASRSQGLTPPAVPTSAQDLQGFKKDMNQFMQDAAAERARQIESQEK
jgi:flagellar basal body-associated protein FliL